MKLLCLALLLAISGYATTLSGTLRNPDGSGANGTLVFQLAQQEALVTTGGCGGPAEISPTYQVKITVTAGALVSPPSIYGNDCMLPSGSFYNITFLDTNGNIVFTDRWQLSGSSVDIGTIVSVVITGTTQSLGTPSIVFTIPTGNQTITQPGGTALSINNFIVTGSFTLPNGGVCNASGCAGIFGNVVDISSAQTITGAKTFNSNILFSGGAGVGTPLFPANNGYFTGVLNVQSPTGIASVITNALQFNQNTLAFQFGMLIRSTAHLSIIDSASVEMAGFDTTGSPNDWFGGLAIYAQAGSATQVPMEIYGASGQTADLMHISPAGFESTPYVFAVARNGVLTTNGTPSVSKSTTVGSCTLTWTNGLLTAFSGGC